MQPFTEALVAAVVQSVGTSAPADGDGGIRGYALIVDPDMMTVLGASVSGEDIEREGNEALLFMPTDWATEYHSEGFEKASEMLAQLSAASLASPYKGRAQRVADCLVSALQRARTGEPSLAHAFLLVSCFDGGGVWDTIEDEAVHRLNDDSVALHRWARSRGHGT